MDERVSLTVDKRAGSSALGRFGCLFMLPVASFNTEAIRLFVLAKFLTAGSFETNSVEGGMSTRCGTEDNTGGEGGTEAQRGGEGGTETRRGGDGGTEAWRGGEGGTEAWRGGEGGTETRHGGDGGTGAGGTPLESVLSTKGDGDDCVPPPAPALPTPLPPACPSLLS